MKKFLLSSAILLIFSFSILIFQASCKKEALAQPPVVNGQNTIMFTMGLKSGNNVQLWLANIDGSNKRQVPVSVPAGSSFIGEAELTPNGRILYVVSRPTSVGWQDEIWGMSINGTNAAKLLDNSHDNTRDLNLLGAW